MSEQTQVLLELHSSLFEVTYEVGGGMYTWFLTRLFLTWQVHLKRSPSKFVSNVKMIGRLSHPLILHFLRSSFVCRFHKGIWVLSLIHSGRYTEATSDFMRDIMNSSLRLSPKQMMREWTARDVGACNCLIHRVLAVTPWTRVGVAMRKGWITGFLYF